MAQTGSNSAAYNVSVSGSPDELYGKDGLRRLASYWKEQDRLLGEGSVEVGPVSSARDVPGKQQDVRPL